MTKCNMCGKDFDMFDTQANNGFYGTIPYGSKYDGDKVDFNLCCECTDKVFDFIFTQCKINPIVEEAY